MPKKSSEQFPERGRKDSEAKFQPKISPEIKLEKNIEVKGENSDREDQEIKKIKREIEDKIAEQPIRVKQVEAKDRARKIDDYQKRYLPDYLRSKKGFVSKLLFGLSAITIGKFEKEGNENIPEKGPFIVIGNHFGGRDDEVILKAFKNTDLHFVIAKEMLWNTSAKWFFKKLGMIPIEASLSNLAEQEKEEALKRQDKKGKKVFRRIIDKEKDGRVAMNFEFVHQAVAVLSRGDAIGIYPEGLLLRPEGAGKPSRERKEMKRGYRGIELVAKQYKKLTGEELPIIPTAYIEDAKTGKRKLIIGQPLKLSENNTGLNGTDWCMKHVAEMLPEEQRGYYKNLSLER